MRLEKYVVLQNNKGGFYGCSIMSKKLIRQGWKNKQIADHTYLEATIKGIQFNSKYN